MNNSACKNKRFSQLYWRCSTKDELNLSENKELVISTDTGKQPVVIQPSGGWRTRWYLAKLKASQNAPIGQSCERNCAFVLYDSEEQNCSQPGKPLSVSWLASPTSIRSTLSTEAAPSLCAPCQPLSNSPRFRDNNHQAPKLTFSQHNIIQVVNGFLIIHHSFMIKECAYILRIYLLPVG